VSTSNGRFRTLLLAVAGARAALGLLAIPLAPLLWHRHFVVLVLLRPTKEVLLAGGFLARRGDVPVVLVVATALPLLLGGVWLFYALGRMWSSELQGGEGLPRWTGRLLPAKRIKAMCSLLDERGPVVVFLGRLAVFPSSLVAAAAGTSDMDATHFLVADGLGGLTSIVEVVGVGYLLGSEYERGRRWITIGGVVILVAVVVIVGRWLRRQSPGKGT
jgi:membrane protein DedA with SNARE-associated domain